QNIPYPLTVTATNINSIALAKGAPSGNQLYGMHALALSSDSLSICSVGANYTGQLGNGNQNARSFLECDVASLVSIEENPTLEIVVYPNPSAGQLYIETEFPFENAQLSDATGRTIQSFDLHAGVNEMRFPSLQSGTYFIQIGEERLKWVVE
ncbi:MAG: Secretion system C-terminal sorting domain, partial [Bacteroidota bacterium]